MCVLNWTYCPTVCGYAARLCDADKRSRDKCPGTLAMFLPITKLILKRNLRQVYAKVIANPSALIRWTCRQSVTRHCRAFWPLPCPPPQSTHRPQTATSVMKPTVKTVKTMSLSWMIVSLHSRRHDGKIISTLETAQCSAQPLSSAHTHTSRMHILHRPSSHGINL